MIWNWVWKNSAPQDDWFHKVLMKITGIFSTRMMPMNWLNPNLWLQLQSDHSNPFKLILKNKIKSKSDIDLTAAYCIVSLLIVYECDWMIDALPRLTHQYTALRSSCKSWLDSRLTVKTRSYRVFRCCGFIYISTRCVCVYNDRLRAQIHLYTTAIVFVWVCV